MKSILLNNIRDIISPDKEIGNAGNYYFDCVGFNLTWSVTTENSTTDEYEDILKNIIVPGKVKYFTFYFKEDC